MNNLDKFRYSYDDPSQLNISLKKFISIKSFKETKTISLALSSPPFLTFCLSLGIEFKSFDQR